MVKFNMFPIHLLITILHRKLLKYTGFSPVISKDCLEFPPSINVIVYDQIEESNATKGICQYYYENKNTRDQRITDVTLRTPLKNVI